MSDLLTVKEPLDYKLVVGSPPGENYIAFEITATKFMEKLYAQITIPCGQAASGKTYLCADVRRANLILQSEPVQKLKFHKEHKDNSP